MSDTIEVPSWLLEKLAKDPKYIEKAQRSVALDEFKSKYEVQRASGLKCPGCLQGNQYGGGSLWGPRTGTDNQYVCRKCGLLWTIVCMNRDVREVIKEIKGK